MVSRELKRYLERMPDSLVAELQKVIAYEVMDQYHNMDYHHAHNTVYDITNDVFDGRMTEIKE